MFKNYLIRTKNEGRGFVFHSPSVLFAEGELAIPYLMYGVFCSKKWKFNATYNSLYTSESPQNIKECGYKVSEFFLKKDTSNV